jgi:hypothetical protein
VNAGRCPPARTQTLRGWLRTSGLLDVHDAGPVKTSPARGGSGPDIVHWEEAGVHATTGRRYQYLALDERQLKVGSAQINSYEELS